MRRVRTEQERVVRARMLHTLLHIRRLRATRRAAERAAAARAQERQQ